MSRNWKGNEPDGADWIFVQFVTAHGNDWGISRKKSLPNGWASFKVFAVGKAANKANYFGSWNGERTAKNKDMGIMKENRPDLLTAIEAALLASK